MKGIIFRIHSQSKIREYSNTCFLGSKDLIFPMLQLCSLSSSSAPIRVFLLHHLVRLFGTFSLNTLFLRRCVWNKLVCYPIQSKCLSLLISFQATHCISLVRFSCSYLSYSKNRCCQLMTFLKLSPVKVAAIFIEFCYSHLNIAPQYNNRGV